MKRIVKVFLILLVLAPTIALADVGMPERMESKVKVTNPDGAYFTDDNSGKKTKVEYGEVFDSMFITKECVSVEVNDKYGCLRLEDVTIMVDAEEYTFRKKNFLFHAYEDANVYEAPELHAKVVGTIKKGSDVQTYYATNEKYGFGSLYDDWEYVMHNGVNGWVYVLNGYTSESYDNDLTEGLAVSSFAKKIKKSIYIIDPETKLFEKPGSESKSVDVTLNVGDIITSDLYYDEHFGQYVYAKIGSNSGWLPIGGQTEVAEDKEIHVFGDTFVFNKPYDDEDKADIKLEIGKNYPVKYFSISKYGGTYGIEINNKLYWLTDASWLYEEVYYMEEEVPGFDFELIDNSKSYEDSKDDPIVEIKSTSSGEIVVEEDPQEPSKKEDKKKTTKTKEENDMLVIYIAVGAGVVTLTAIVVMILIKKKMNKKKKAAMEVPKTENVEIKQESTVDQVLDKVNNVDFNQESSSDDNSNGNV